MSAGPATLAADKTVEANAPSTNTLRAVVYGINHHEISDGTIATVNFDVAAIGNADVSVAFTQVVASDADAQSVTINTSDFSGTLTDSGLTPGTGAVDPGNPNNNEGGGSDGGGSCFIDATIN